MVIYLCTFAICSLNKNIPGHTIRQVSQIHVISHSTKARENRFIGTKLWNLLDSQIINSPTIYVFKRLPNVFHNVALCTFI